MPTSQEPDAATSPALSLRAVVALGVGGMLGAGLYTLLGLATLTSGGLLPVAFGLAAIAAAFVVYGTVSAGHLRLRSKTGARTWPLVAAVVVNAALLIVLRVHAVQTGPASVWLALLAALVGCFGFEVLYRRRSRRHPSLPDRVSTVVPYEPGLIKLRLASQ